jgi:hypothetical protein
MNQGPVQWGTGWVASEPVWMFWRRQNSPAPVGIWIPDRLAHSLTNQLNGSRIMSSYFCFFRIHVFNLIFILKRRFPKYLGKSVIQLSIFIALFSCDNTLFRQLAKLTVSRACHKGIWDRKYRPPPCILKLATRHKWVVSLIYGQKSLRCPFIGHGVSPVMELGIQPFCSQELPNIPCLSSSNSPQRSGMHSLASAPALF